ncbi:MAG: sulfite exporter TauE/SafE family protein [Vicinamibacterales bacterium]
MSLAGYNPPIDPLSHNLIAFAAAFVAGAVNSVAGGGSLVSFPTLVWLGLPSITANATNTVAVWPGSLGSMWGYRRELRDTEPRMYALIGPSLVGGIAGALLLRITPGRLFDQIVPLLILFATFLFMAQEPVQRWFNRATPGHHGARWLAGGMLFQLLVGVYGGYFGAGIGILMLAALSIMGHDDIHQMNGFKNMLAVFVNGIAAIYFIWAGMVSWPDAIVMAVGAVLGGVGGADVARRLGRVAVRRIVIAIGFGMAAALMVRL